MNFTCFQCFGCFCVSVLSHQSFTVASLSPFNINTFREFTEAIFHAGNNISRLYILFWKEDTARDFPFKVEEIRVVEIHVLFQGVKDYCALFHPAAFVLVLRRFDAVKCGVHHICQKTACLTVSLNHLPLTIQFVVDWQHPDTARMMNGLLCFQFTRFPPYFCAETDPSHIRLLSSCYSEEHSISMKSGKRGHLFPGQSAP